MLKYEQLIEKLNDSNLQTRLSALEGIMQMIKTNEIEAPKTGEDVNCHIHTWYSFSPYSPTKAVYMAYMAGLKTAGIMDHDSVAGIEEFHKAGLIAGLYTTAGFEVRVSVDDTQLSGRRINNPDQMSIAYIAIHGMPQSGIKATNDLLAPLREKRNQRNIKMIEKINKITAPFNISLSFEEDVLPLSKYNEGGSVTERHLLFALSKKLCASFGKGEKIVEILQNELKIQLNSKALNLLNDSKNNLYEYDLLNVLKGELVEKFYINADEECPKLSKIKELCTKTGAILAYAYLGDVGDSVTGDKKTQKFEDDYLELLFETIKQKGFNAVTYMPSRNTEQQLKRLRSLCEQYAFMQISGEDINSPRQSFVCEAIRRPEFKNLIDATWALIGHEKNAKKSLESTLFSQKSIEQYPNINDRINAFKNM